VTLDQAGSSSLLPQTHAASGAASTAGTAAGSQTTHTYQPHTGGYPYALGSWGYHYPQFPTVSPSVTASGVTQGDSAANIVASGTFPYPYTAAQFAPGQSAYVPPIKYPYGAPAIPVTVPAVSPPPTGPTPMSSTAQTQEERPYKWKRPYTGPQDPTSAVEPQVHSESTPSNDAHESKQNPDEVVTSITNGDNVVPATDNPAPTSSTAGVTA